MRKKYSFFFRLFIAANALLFANQVCANIITSNTVTGNWSATTSWIGGVVPRGTDDVIISAGAVITIDGTDSCNNLTTNATGQLKCTAIHTLTISGNFTNAGSISLINGTFYFDGSSTQTITGPTAPSFFNLTINPAAVNDTVILATPITINNNFVINQGAVNCLANQITGNAIGNMVMLSNTTLLLGSHLVATAVNFPTVYTTAKIALANTSNVIYTANTNQTISATPTYGNLEVTGGTASTTNTLANNTTVSGNLLIQNGTGAVTLSASIYTLTIAGNYTDNGSFNCGTGNVTFNGTSGLQTLTLPAGGENFYDITFNNTSAANPNITASNNINVADNTTFTLGNLDLQGHNYVITGSAAATNDNFNGGAIFTSVPGSNFTVTDPSKTKMIKFWGTKIGTVANGVTINVNAGRIQFDNFTEYGTANFTKTLNTDDVFGGGNVYHGPVTFTAARSASRWRMGDGPAIPDTFYNASFNAFANSGSNNNFIVGANSIGNAFYGTTHMTSNTIGGFYVCRNNGNGNASCAFHGPVAASIDSTGNITYADASAGHDNTTTFDSSITISSTAVSTGFYHFADNNTHGKVVLNTGAQFNTGLISGKTNVYLCNVTQYGNLTQTINTTGSTGAQFIGGVTTTPAFKCTFNGPCNFLADTAGYVVGCTFNNTVNINVNHPSANGYIVSDSFNNTCNAIVGNIKFQNNVFANTATLQHTANIASATNGGNIFNGAATIINSGTSTLECGATAGDNYNNNVTFTENGTGSCLIEPAYGNTSTFAGNITVNGTNANRVIFGASSGTMSVNGTGTQIFSLGGSAVVPNIVKLSMNMTQAGTNILQFNFSPAITSNLTFGNNNNGLINLNGNTLTVGTSTVIPGTILYPAPPSVAGWVYGGNFARWVGSGVSIPLPTSGSVATTGFFPLGSSSVQNNFEPFWFSTSGTTALGNIITLSQPSTTNTMNLITPYVDATWNGGTTIAGISNAEWTIGTGTTTLSGGSSAELMFGGFGFQAFAFPSNSNASNVASAVANYSAAVSLYSSSDVEVKRTNLTIAQINANPNWYIGVMKPSAPTATSNSPVCIGDTIKLFASTIAGATYSWTGPSGFTSTNQNPTIPNAVLADAGTYSVTATVGLITSSDGTVTVSVTAAPASPTASATPNPICSGTQLQLNASTVAGATYNWTGPHGFNSTNQNPTIANILMAQAGTYSVTATVGASCASPPGTVTVVVDTTPAKAVAGSNTPVCSGSALNFNSSNVTGASYSWTGPNGFTSNSQAPSINPVLMIDAGTYSVTTTIGSCSSGIATTNVVVDSTPAQPIATNNTPICSGDTLRLFASNVNGASYAWGGPDFGSSLPNPTLPNSYTAETGVYLVQSYIVYSAFLTCYSPKASTIVIIDSTPPTPTASSNSPLCVGDTLNLSATTISGASYVWKGPDGFSATNQNPTVDNVTTLNAGTYYVKVHVNATGCKSKDSGQTVVVINPIPSPPSPLGSNSPVCSGKTIHLTSTTEAGVTYSWTGPDGFNSTNQNPSIPNSIVADSGIYTVTAVENGCSSLPVTIDVAVDSTPPTPIATSNSPVCINNTLQLFANPTITGASYSWTGPLGFTSTDQNPIIPSANPSMSGTYSVIATSAVGGCTNNTPGTVTVIVSSMPATPVASANPNPLCSGTTLSLTATTVAGATNYNWTGPDGFTATSQDTSIAVTIVANTGTYSVTASNAGCTTPAGTITVTVDSTPAAPIANANPNPICSGATIDLTASTVTGATSYNWTGPYGFSSTDQNPFIINSIVAESGTYSVTATEGSCTSVAGTIAVVVDSNPSNPQLSSNSPVCSGTTLQLTIASIPGASYSWSGPNSFSSTNQDPSVNGTILSDSGTYSVTITVAGCPGATIGNIDIAVDTTPASAVASSSPPNPICSGLTLSLNASTVNGVTYAWSGPEGFSSTNQNPSILNTITPESGTYSVTTTIGSCTSAPGTVAVVIDSTPGTPIVSSNSPVCTGTTLNLNANSITGASYSWSGPNTFSATNQNPSINNVALADAGNYSVTVSIGVCVGGTGSTNVTVNQTPPAPTASSNSPLCPGSTLNLNATVVAGATYTWIGPNGFTSVSQDTLINSVTSAANGTYSVVATVTGCSDTGTTAVIINPTPTVTITPPIDTICLGNSTTLTGNGANNGYAWSPSIGLSCTSCQSPIANPTSPTTYKVVGTNSFGCTDSSTINLVVKPKPIPVITALPSNDSICSGDSAKFVASGGETYKWTPGNMTSDTVWVKPTLNTTYTLSASNGGCTIDTTLSLTVSPPININLAAFDTICTGDSITLVASGGGTYLWSNGSTNNSIKVGPTATTNYAVIVKNGCIDSARTKVTVDVPSLQVCCNDTIIEGDTVRLVATGATSYVWIPAASLSCNNCPDPIASPTVTTTYTVTSKDKARCSLNGTVIIDVEAPCGKYQAPNVFTPNGDGINDVFIINLNNPTSYSITIFDRWGKEVFTSTNVKDYWNGKKDNTGPLVSDGTYYYIIDANCGSNAFNTKGYVQVLGEK
jgi:gliding motility-associated-like protein